MVRYLTASFVWKPTHNVSVHNDKSVLQPAAIMCHVRLNMSLRYKAFWQLIKYICPTNDKYTVLNN